MKVLIILLVMCAAVVAQSRDNLKKKYGEAIAETYLIRPGILVTASYDSSDQISELVIAPQLAELIKSQSRGLDRKTLNEVINELVPTSERGRGLYCGFFNIGCMPRNDCYGSYMEYERLMIYYNAGQHGEVNYAVIRLKK
jgi:hypothetical protein